MQVKNVPLFPRVCPEFFSADKTEGPRAGVGFLGEGAATPDIAGWFPEFQDNPYHFPFTLNCYSTTLRVYHISVTARPILNLFVKIGLRGQCSFHVVDDKEFTIITHRNPQNDHHGYAPTSWRKGKQIVCCRHFDFQQVSVHMGQTDLV